MSAFMTMDPLRHLRPLPSSPAGFRSTFDRQVDRLPYGCLLFMYRLDLTWRQKGRPPRPRVSLRVSWSFWNPCLRVGRSAPLPVNGMQLEEHCHSLSVRSCYVAGHAATPRRTGPHPRSPKQASKHEGRSLRFALGLHRTSTPLKGRLCSSAAPSKHKCTRRVCVEVMRSIFKTQPAPYASDVCFESLSTLWTQENRNAGVLRKNKKFL